MALGVHLKRTHGFLLAIALALNGCSLLVDFDASEFQGGFAGSGGVSAGSGGLGGAPSSGGGGVDGTGAGQGTGGASPSGGASGVTLEPVHHYTFDDGVGTVVTDTGSDPQDGVVSVVAPSVPNWQAAGVIDGALSLADNQHVHFSSAVAATASFTVMMWVLPAKPEGRSIFDKRDTGTTGFRLQLNPSTGGDRVQFLVGSILASTTIDGSFAFSLTDYRHVAVTYETREGSDLAQIFVNGSLDGNANQDFPGLGLNTTTPFRVGTPAEDLTIPGFVGIVDDLRVYDVALSRPEIKAIYDAGKPGP